LQLAAAKLAIPEDELHYEIVEQGRRGVFGLGARSVRIRVMPPLDEQSAVEELAAEDEDDDNEIAVGTEPVTTAEAQAVERTLQRMLELLGLQILPRAETGREGLSLRLTGADERLLTQNDSELLFALQFLLNRMAKRSWPQAGRIHLTCDGERRRRDDDLVAKARTTAQEVLRSGSPRRLHPLNAYERRLVHLTIREYGGLDSRSEGEGPLKRVKISKSR
jgi:spoIIIJ-associated protein